ncbi:MAG: hypothetical protein AB7Q17_10410 [Phycisphaerae bacterium]
MIAMIQSTLRSLPRRILAPFARAGVAGSIVAALSACAPAAKRPVVELVPPLSESAFDEFASSVAERIVAATRASRSAPAAIAPPRVSAGGVEPTWIASNFATALAAALNDRLAGAATISQAATTRPAFRSAVQFARSTRDPQARAVAFALWDADERLVFREARGYASGVLPEPAEARRSDAARSPGSTLEAAAAPNRTSGGAAAKDPQRASVSVDGPPAAAGERRSEDRAGGGTERSADARADAWFALDAGPLRTELLSRAEAMRSRTHAGVDGAVVLIDACADEHVELLSQYWSTSPDGRPRVEFALRAKRAPATVLLRVLFLDERGAASGVTPVVPAAIVPGCEVTIALAAEDPRAAQYIALFRCTRATDVESGGVAPGGG